MRGVVVSSVHRRTIVSLARYFACRNHFSQPPKLRLFNLLPFTLLFFAVMAFLNEQAALSQTSRASQRPSSAHLQGSQQKYNEGALMILGGYPSTTYFD